MNDDLKIGDLVHIPANVYLWDYETLSPKDKQLGITPWKLIKKTEKPQVVLLVEPSTSSYYGGWWVLYHNQKVFITMRDIYPLEKKDAYQVSRDL